jgi:hypothetical protein
MYFYSVKSEQSFTSVIQTMGGTAVYKARTLNAIYQPNAQYNDRVLCVPNTQNKMASSTSIVNSDSLDEALLLQENNVLNYMQHIIKAEPDLPFINTPIATTIVKADFQLLPNPSNGAITIIYNSDHDGELQIINAQGQLIEKLFLEKGNKRIETILQNVVSGIYTYKIDFVNQKKSGKLIIVK